MSLSKQQKNLNVCCVKLSKTRWINGLCCCWVFSGKQICCRWLPKWNRHPSILPKKRVSNLYCTCSVNTACMFTDIVLLIKPLWQRSHERPWNTAVRFSRAVKVQFTCCNDPKCVSTDVRWLALVPLPMVERWERRNGGDTKMCWLLKWSLSLADLGGRSCKNSNRHIFSKWTFAMMIKFIWFPFSVWFHGCHGLPSLFIMYIKPTFYFSTKLHWEQLLKTCLRGSTSTVK